MSTPRKDYERCPVCGESRWKGLVLPICENCQQMDIIGPWLAFRHALKSDNASGSVIALFDTAMIADAKEQLADFHFGQRIRGQDRTPIKFKP